MSMLFMGITDSSATAPASAWKESLDRGAKLYIFSSYASRPEDLFLSGFTGGIAIDDIRDQILMERTLKIVRRRPPPVGPCA